MRDLVRAWTAAVETQRVHRQHITSFMLKHGRIFPRKKRWSMRYMRWLQEQHFKHPAHQIALQEMVEALRVASKRIKRIEAAIEEFVPSWSLEPLVRSLQALRGVDLILAVTFAAEVGDVTRFENPRQLRAISVWSQVNGLPAHRFAEVESTKADNSRGRHMLVESAWTYRHPPRIGLKKLYIHERVSPMVREIAGFMWSVGRAAQPI